MHSQDVPSAWFVHHAPLIKRSANVLDVACGQGRHARFFAQRSALITAVDRDAAALKYFADTQNVTTECRDLEGDAWPYATSSFDAILVCNYLWRPTFDELLATLKAGGVLLYETFMDGNEGYGKPSRPDFLLRPNELLARTREVFRVVAFEEGSEINASGEIVAIKQKIAAVKL